MNDMSATGLSALWPTASMDSMTKHAQAASPFFPPPVASYVVKLVVLQKLMGAWGEAAERSLCGHPEQLVDDTVLGEDIPLDRPLNRPL
jgi:hypothetical protein